ncbi:MAG: hypothetical protein AB8C46_18735 [Burkholderiaceae bacterium]
MFDLYLTPLAGTLVFVVAVICGHRFRLAWKRQDAGWQMRAWCFGSMAALGLLILAFVPLVVE